MATKSRYTLLAALIMVAAGFWAFYRMSYWASRGGQSAPLYSARRYDPYGTAALGEFLAKRGLKVRTLERSRPDRLDQGVIIQVLPVESDRSGVFGPPPQLHTQSLHDWIAQGHTVIQCTAQRTDLMEACGVPSGGGQTDVRLWQEIEKQMSRGTPPNDLPGEVTRSHWLQRPVATPAQTPASLAPVVLRQPMTLPSEPTRLWKPLAGHGRHTVVIGAQRVGAGQLIVVASPTPLLNGSLDAGGNLAMILSLVNSGPVLIDEWSHGIGQSQTMIGIMKSLGVMPVVFQVVVVVGFYTWTTWGYRRTNAEQPLRKRSSVEQITTLGYLYSRSMPPAERTRRVEDEVLHRLATAIRCPPADVTRQLTLLTNSTAAQKIGTWLDRRRTPHPTRHPACVRCGYNLTGSTGRTCPDCKAKVSPSQLRQLGDHGREHHHGGVEHNLAKLLTLSYQLARELKRERIQ